jgi:5-methylcytosine-specific restriction endonuclease McrA
VPGKVIDLLNQRFGKIIVRKFVGVRDRNAVWTCECACGKFADLQGGQLRAGHHKSCGCLGGRRRPYESHYNSLIYTAKRRGQDISITYEDYVTFSNTKTCHYCGIGILWKAVADQKTNRSNLDRKENSIGYTLDNCVVCCYDCNVAKGAHFTYDEFMLLAPTLRAIQRRRLDHETTN